LGRCGVDGFEGRCTEAVDLLACHCLRVTRIEYRGACDVSALLAYRLSTTQYYVIDQRGIQGITPCQRCQNLGRERYGTDFMK
jgi:hypothetical protein